MLEALKFVWNATRGSRLRPWKSPYLRWRVETYAGQKAEQVSPSDMAKLAWKERSQMVRFAGWLKEMGELRHPRP